MAATIWKTNADTGDLAIATEPGDQFAPSVADSGGGSFGVAWTSAAGVTARFFDVVGAVDPALGTVQLSDSQGVIAGNAVLTAGGAVGYGAVWQEKTAADATDIGLRLRYVGLSGTVGNEIAVGDVAGTVQHDAAVSGYAVDNPATRKSAVDGINVVYVQTTLATPEVAGDARYGKIMLQRFAVPLDAKVDPIGPPVAAGLDGLTAGSPIAHTELGDAAVNVANAIGRDPTTIVTDDGEAILAWIDAANHVRLQGFTLAGANLNGGIAGADLASLDAGGAGAVTGKVKLVDLSGAGFAVAWAAQQPDGTIAIMGRVFSGAAGVYTASPITTLQGGLPGTFNGEFSLGTLVDSGGFSLSWTQGNAGGGQDIMVKNFTSGGLSDNQVSTIASTAGDQNAPSIGALLGDRIIAVYQNDPSAAAGDQDIRATIFDTRTPGVTLNGDIGGNGQPRAIADTLVGTVGNDTLNGLAADDDLHGALGNDTMTGGAGNDLLFGDDGNDVAVYTGTQDQYIIQHPGGGIFTVTDKTAGRDGVDTVSGVETFRFAGVDVSAASIIAGIQPITPTPWGQSNADGDTAPDKAGTPDTDGFLVNHAPAVQAGVQTHPFVADSVGEFVGVAWDTAGANGDTHIRAQFYDVVGAFDTTSPLPNAIDLSDGVGVETNPALVSGGNNSGWGVTFEQRGNAQDVSRELRTNFVGPGQLTSVELSVDPESDNVDQHSAAMSGSMLDRKLVNGVVQGPDQILPKGMNDGYNVAWVSTDLSSGQPTNVSGDARYGRVMLQRFEVPLDALGNPGAPQAAGVDGLLGVDSDAAVQVAALGRDVSTASLHTFETAVVWIEPEGAGGERVAGKVYDDLGQSFPVAGFDNLSGAFPVAAGTTAKVVMAGAVNFGVVWVTPSTTVPGGFDVMGSYFSSPGTGLNGQGFTLGGFGPVKLFGLPAGTDATALNLAVTGIGGEDSNDLIVGWNDNGDMKAQHIAVALDPVTGVALAMTPEGNPVTVNATTDGIQDQGGLAGLLGDRFFAVYHDTSAIDGDGNDIVGRMFDTRDAANPDPIVGDLIRNGVAQARRDILVGTNGNDNIRGDISDSVGLTDTIYGGMGNDTIQGGPGLKGAAGVPEIIDGGEGTDIEVYSGRRQDYSMTVNGDGSIEVIDLRPIADAQGRPLPNDGIDNLFNMERLRFLATGEEIAVNLPGAPGPKPVVPPGGVFDGTPMPWSLTDTSQYKPILVSTDPAGGPGGQPGSQTGVAVTNLQTEAAMAWVSGGSQVWGIRYQVQGTPDPLFSLTPVQLTDGTSAAATVSDIDIGMTAGLGFTAVWKSTANGDSTIHLRTGSTNTNTPLDPAAGVPGAGLTGGEITVGASQDAGTATADEPVVEGYEIVNDANDTLEFGFHIGFVMKAAASDTYGTLELARYEIPVYDIAVDAAGNPVLDANGNGVLARDAAGNLVPSADLSKGAETAPIGLGLDGLRGTADDNVGIVLTSNGLERADTATGTPVQGRDISLATLHDGQVVVTYIGTDEHVHLRIFVPDTNQTADRDTSAITVPGLITYKELALSAGFPTDLGEVRSGQTQHVVAQQNGSFGVFWGANDTSGTPGVITNAAAVQGMIFSGAGTNWSPSPLLTLETGLAPSVNFQVASSGVDPIGIENGFVLTWEQPNGTLAAQRFDMKGAAVGKLVGVDDPATGPHTGLSAVGIDDDRILLGYQNGADIIAQYLDTREPGASIIGPRTGAPRDVAVGTVGDDSMDGRALADQLYGGLGNDLITLGSGADIGVGGLGNDTIIGGPGQDQLLGEDGDDLLAGGFSGPADPKVDRDLQTGLAAAGISPAVIAGELGADIVSGGAGKDTITFQSEVGKFDINLATGMVMSDRGATGTFALEDVIGAIVDDGAGGTIFRFTKDVENAVGGEGDDMLTGDAGDNVLDGGPGNNTIDGGGGNDTVVLHGKFADNTVNFTAASNTFTIAGAGSTDTIVNVENFQFDDVTKTLAQLTSGTTGPDSAAPTDIVFNGDTKAVSVSLAENSAAGVVVTTLATIDPDTAAGLATDRFTYTLDQTTAFQIVGNKIVVKDPAPLDFEATKTFALKVTTRDTAGPANSFSKPLTVNLTNVNEAPTTVTFTPAAFAESAANGTSVGTLSATDPDAGDTARFQLADDAGGRFMIVGNTLQVAENLLLDHRGDDTNQTYTVQVRAIDAGSLSSKVQPFSVTATGATENRVIGTAADNAALNGTAGADYIDGGAGRDTMTGGAGNDSYVVDNSSDKVVENAGGGTDTIYTRLASFDLGSATNVENMVFIGTGAFNGRLNNVGGTLIGGAAGDQLQGGTGNDVLKGLAGNDVISANNGSDTLIGGAGNDTMTGGTGADVFAFLGGSGTDTITDFGATAGANQDILQLSTSIAKDFASLQASGAISQSGQNIVINLGGSDTVTLQKIALNAIDASDFRFV